ncbi:MAG: N-acetyl-gamma-glutamyl-phosphate reductase [Alistipes sp.]|nr:N-acetyl-gamma-glutamyl-phosphate reductase [Candidatus Alistipes equi]
MIRVGIMGAAGYTAGELIRILVNHPQVEIIFAQSESNAGNPVRDIHEGLIGETDMRFCKDVELDSIDVLFICRGHGASSVFWQTHKAPKSLRIIDLAEDFRDESEGYVYGLPEWQYARIEGALKVANPGCFATAIQLSLLPLASAGLLSGEVCVTAVTGSTGAGQKPSPTTHFSWRADNISAYKVLEHQHLKEIRRNLMKASSSDTQPLINFIPLRGDFTRGIFSTACLECKMEEEQVRELFKKYYMNSAFTFISDSPVDLKQVINTNKCVIDTQVHDGKLVVSCVIDNLLKGASGQAVQNMNIMFKLPQKEGLRLKASAF